jgi:hypothetical protein
MHTASRTVDAMTGISEEALTVWLAGQGVTVVEVDGGGDLGWYDLGARTVALRRGLLPSHRVPVLMHECYHVARGDEGHQQGRVEEWIDEQVACRLIGLPDYARAEQEYGWNTGAIAAELSVPKWCVRAYRRALEKAVRQASA